MNNNPLIAKQFNPFVRKSSAYLLSSLADTNLNTVQEPQAETPGAESESGPGPEPESGPGTPVAGTVSDVPASGAAPTNAPAADADPVSGAPSPAAESSTPSPAAPVSAEEARAPQAPAPQQADNASGNQSRRHRRLN